MMKASEARAITDKARSLEGEVFKKITEEVLKLIKKHAERGDSQVTYSCDGLGSITNRIIQSHLQELGYEVKFTSDQRDGNFFTIRW